MSLTNRFIIPACALAVGVLVLLAVCGSRASADRRPCRGSPPVSDTVARSPKALLCDTLAELLRVPVSRRLSVACDTLLSDPGIGTSPWPRRGCFIHVADSTDASAPATDELDTWFREHGWLYAIQYSADGPDGTLFGYVRDALLCVVEGHWDGGDDSDSTYVPLPGYEVTVKCVSSVPADTAR